MRNLPEHYTRYKHRFMGSNMARGLRTLAGISGFVTRGGHLVIRAWGIRGSSLCGQTVDLQNDPVPVVSDYNGPRPSIGACCMTRFSRMQRRLAHS